MNKEKTARDILRKNYICYNLDTDVNGNKFCDDKVLSELRTLIIDGLPKESNTAMKNAVPDTSLNDYGMRADVKDFIYDTGFNACLSEVKSAIDKLLK